MPKTRHLCVFCSSSGEIDKEYFRAARELGEEIARRKLALVYGGSDLGLMGELARSAHKHGGKIVGIIPKGLHLKVPALKAEHELIVTEDLRHRKTVMEMRSDAFVALPGGFGTLEELMEILTLKQLGYHNKPIVLLNTKGFYDPLISFFEKLFKDRFAHRKNRELYRLVPTVKSVFECLERCQIS